MYFQKVVIDGNSVAVAVSLPTNLKKPLTENCFCILALCHANSLISRQQR